MYNAPCMGSSRLALTTAVVLLPAALAAQEPKPSDAPPPLPPAVDLRPEIQRLGLGPRSQGRRPTCSVFTVVSTLEITLAEATGEAVRLSPEFANRSANVVTGEALDGGFFHDILAGIAADGIVREASFPYARRFDPDAEPAVPEDQLAEEAHRLRETIARRLRLVWVKPWSKRSGLDDGQFDQVRRALARGLPVGTGTAHSRTLVGYRDDPDAPGGGVFLTLDSGVGRFAEVSYTFVRERLFDVFYFEVVPKPPDDKEPGAGHDDAGGQNR